ncbi:1923_t:CDS:1 [Funneliformis mosseae]|uniref:1923_t:CDS:1 n=1 Tax=Funneliformis mosseae TaxID=27381 RepID=A0A9N9A307_FUNMO|nr:1923_t:CDS:1 [Funneliformis mosseae]
MNLLKRKLLGGANNFENSRKGITSLAILSSVVGLDMSPQSKFASELVASHMATCLAVSEDRERLIVVYPSEPLLSEAAFELMSASTLSQILTQFNILLKKGIVEPGPRGEIVARIILVLVAYRLRAQRAENSVKAFLNELYKEGSMPDLRDAKQEFIEGTVAFIHFNAIEYVPTKKTLEEFYIRRCAFIMKRNHPGADICIPVKLVTGGYSIIIIQIKNINSSSVKADENYPFSARSMFSCNYVFDNSDLKEHDEQYLCLYWQLHFQGHYQEIPKLQDTRSSESRKLNIYWASFGFNHFKMIKDIASILKDILVSHISLFESEW